jgi:hypothetical protein
MSSFVIFKLSGKIITSESHGSWATVSPEVYITSLLPAQDHITIQCLYYRSCTFYCEYFPTYHISSVDSEPLGVSVVAQPETRSRKQITGMLFVKNGIIFIISFIGRYSSESAEHKSYESDVNAIITRFFIYRRIGPAQVVALLGSISN